MVVKSLTLAVMIESSKELVNLVRISVKGNSGKKAIENNLHDQFLNSLSYLRVVNSFQEAAVTCLHECVHVHMCVCMCVYYTFVTGRTDSYEHSTGVLVDL